MDAHFGDLALHQLRVGSLIAGVTNQEPVATQLKDGALKGDRWPFRQFRRVVGGIGDVGLQTVEHGVDLRGLEAGDGQIEADFRQRQLELAELERQDLAGPRRSWSRAGCRPAHKRGVLSPIDVRRG